MNRLTMNDSDSITPPASPPITRASKGKHRAVTTSSRGADFPASSTAIRSSTASRPSTASTRTSSISSPSSVSSVSTISTTSASTAYNTPSQTALRPALTTPSRRIPAGGRGVDVNGRAVSEWLRRYNVHETNRSYIANIAQTYPQEMWAQQLRSTIINCTEDMAASLVAAMCESSRVG